MNSYEQLYQLINNINISRLVYNYYRRDFPPKWSMERIHFHEAIEIICCLEGTLNIILNSNITITVKKSDCLIIQESRNHYLYVEEKACRCVCVHINKKSIDYLNLQKIIKNMKYNIFDDTIYNNDGYVKVLDNKTITSCVDRIVHELNSKDEEYDFLVKTEIVGLILIISRNLSKQNNYGYNCNNLASHYISRAIVYMKQEMLNPIRPNDIAKYVNISANYLMHIFKNSLNKSLMQQLTELRIERSKELLTNTTLNISEVAYQCGYMNLQHFSMVFKKMVGITPMMYRRRSNEFSYIKSK